jgi:hypothetical protein
LARFSTALSIYELQSDIQRRAQSWRREFERDGMTEIRDEYAGFQEVAAVELPLLVKPFAENGADEAEDRLVHRRDIGEDGSSLDFLVDLIGGGRGLDLAAAIAREGCVLTTVEF